MSVFVGLGSGGMLGGGAGTKFGVRLLKDVAPLHTPPPPPRQTDRGWWWETWSCFLLVPLPRPPPPYPCYSVFTPLGLGLSPWRSLLSPHQQELTGDVMRDPRREGKQQPGQRRRQSGFLSFVKIVISFLCPRAKPVIPQPFTLSTCISKAQVTLQHSQGGSGGLAFSFHHLEEILELNCIFLSP